MLAVRWSLAVVVLVLIDSRRHLGGPRMAGTGWAAATVVLAVTVVMSAAGFILLLLTVRAVGSGGGLNR